MPQAQMPMQDMANSRSRCQTALWVLNLSARPGLVPWKSTFGVLCTERIVSAWHRGIAQRCSTFL